MNKIFVLIAVVFATVIIASVFYTQQPPKSAINIENGTAPAITTATGVVPKTICYSNPSVNLKGIVSNLQPYVNNDGTIGGGTFILTLSNGTQYRTYIESHCLGQGSGCEDISLFIGYVPKDGDNVIVAGALSADKPIDSDVCPSPHLSASKITKD